ncbi:MAG: hypothetical protein AAF560_19165 [Acidobacteriota bacterium]
MPEHRLQCLPHRLLAHHRVMGLDPDLWCLLSLTRPHLAAPQLVHGAIVRDTKQPRPQIARLTHHRQLVVSRRQGVLHHVLSVEHRAEQSGAVAVQLRPHVAHHLEKLPARLASALQLLLGRRPRDH